ncbi:MAG TPA: FGGY-family carbohydrate kinase [Symbiobacteriaceae bacterium]|nr:FGGY-family carbohydrate kinase [Symbiobacteriaceae bacterium]
MDALLGVDIGTTALKSVLFDFHGRRLWQADAEYPTRHPATGWAEQDPDDWWRAFCHTMRRMTGDIGKVANIVAIGVSSQAPTMLPVDRSLKPVRPALIWMDRRSESQCEWLRREVGEERIRSITGNRTDPYYMASELLWFKQTEPELYAHTRCLLQANGYVNLRLTGELSIDLSHCALTQLFDIARDCWSTELLVAMGVDPALLPPVSECTDVIGRVTAAAAAETGLPVGIPVVAGAVDGVAAALEAGVLDPGEAAEMTGTSTVLILPVGTPRFSPDLTASRHALPDTYLLFGAMSTTGASLRWFRDQLGAAEVAAARELGTDPYDMLTSSAGAVPPGANGVIFLPYMAGERAPIWNTNARGVFAGLSMATTRADLVRAVLEGSVFALAHNIEAAEGVGVEVRDLRSVGGGARSPLWCQIKADVLGRPVLLPRTAVGAPFGDAVLAGRGVGIYPDLKTPVRSTVTVSHRFEPNPEAHDRYREVYRVYRSIYEHLRPDFDRLAEVQQR